MQACEQGHLPDGWSVEEVHPWRNGTLLVAPERKGGVLVRDRHVSVQLPGSGPASPRVEITDEDQIEFVGRGWRERVTQAAVRAAKARANHFTDPDGDALNRRPAHTYVNWREL